MKLLVKQKKRSAVSPVIATLLLIAIAVAAAIIVYAFVTGLIGGLTGGSSGLIVESGTLSIPSGIATDGTVSSYGSLVVTVKNSGSAPIASVVITEISNTAVCDPVAASNPNSAACVQTGPVAGDGWAQAAGAYTWTALKLGTTTIPTGQTLSFASPISGSPIPASPTAGTTYSYSVTVTFSTGTGNNIQTLSLVAQT